MTDYSNNLDLLRADDRRSVNHYETKMAAPTEVMDDIRGYLEDTSSESEFSGFDVQSDYNVSDVSIDSDSDVGGGATRGCFSPYFYLNF